MRARSVLLPLLAAAWVGLAVWRGGGGAPPTSQAPGAAQRLDPTRVVVLDGDTLRVAGDGGGEIRLVGVDTPEKSAPWFDGDQEPWASRATDFVREALRRARRVTLLSRGRRDRYGRRLAHVLVDGESLSVLLVEAGLGYATVDRYGDGGFPALADEVVRRARPPAFPPPWRWRRTHRLR